jgi:hypothetical protein
MQFWPECVFYNRVKHSVFHQDRKKPACYKYRSSTVRMLTKIKFNGTYIASNCLWFVIDEHQFNNRKEYQERFLLSNTVRT